MMIKNFRAKFFAL